MKEYSSVTLHNKVGDKKHRWEKTSMLVGPAAAQQNHICTKLQREGDWEEEQLLVN